MGTGFGAEVVSDFGEGVDDFLVSFVLAVENAERIGFGAALIVGAELIFDRSEGFAECGVVADAILGGADGVELETPVADA